MTGCIILHDVLFSNAIGTTHMLICFDMLTSSDLVSSKRIYSETFHMKNTRGKIEPQNHTELNFENEYMKKKLEQT